MIWKAIAVGPCDLTEAMEAGNGVLVRTQVWEESESISMCFVPGARLERVEMVEEEDDARFKIVSGEEQE